MSAIKPEKWQGADAVTCAEALSDLSYTLFFDSNRPSHPLSQWSFICWNPVEAMSVKNQEGDFFSDLQERLKLYQSRHARKRDDASIHHIPFTGGAAGYFGYDLGRQLETIPDSTKDDMNISDACIGIYTNVLAFDHSNDEAWIIADDEAKETLHECLQSLRRKEHAPVTLNWQAQKTDDNYLKDIQTVIDNIYAGEVYQVNLSRRFDADLPDSFDTFAHYKHLRTVNPAPFSTFMNFGGVKLASCSPERFLSVKENEVETRPIKGTLPATQPVDNLTGSAKDRAENTMIVDLLRNDLSKVCDFHSVKAPDLCKPETFEGLHHLVSTVKGILQKDKTAIDLLRACFPGGSITGAPKIRAMEIIEELEPTRRGAYCGAMGYIGFDGDMDTNITIRTLIYANNKVYLQTGSGIVSDSVPEKELQESLDKAQKIFESFEINNSKENAA